MNRFLLLLIFPLLLNAQSKKIRVLFLGNSYTYVNNLPLLVYNVALSKGDTLVYDSYTPGGYSLGNHSADATSISKISQGNWDYVVLQAQSQEPSFSPMQVSAQTLPYALKLDSLIKHYNTCANTVFYETWGRKSGDAMNCANYPPVCTYTGMQNRLRDSYKLFADSVHDVMAPVGEAFRSVVTTSAAIELYQPDQSHPSLEGSYLAAAVFYETLFQRSVLTSTYNPGIASGTLSYFNQVAHQIVTDSSMTWNIAKYLPDARFTFSSQASSFQFQAGSGNFSNQWYFGDGSGSGAANPVHSYQAPGTYTVSHVAYNASDCKRDSVAHVVVASSTLVTTTGITEQDNAEIFLYPNPCTSTLRINVTHAFEHAAAFIEIRNVMGQLLLRQPFAKTVDTSPLKNGLYYIRISGPHSAANSCFIKNE